MDISQCEKTQQQLHSDALGDSGLPQHKRKRRETMAKKEAVRKPPEGFLEVPRTNGRYFINQLGQIFSLASNRLLSPSITQTGYYSVMFAPRCCSVKRCFVHRILAEVFIGPPQGMEVDHINRIKTDNRLCNLRYVTRQINAQNQRKPGRRKTSHQPWSRFKGVHYLSSGVRNRWRAMIVRGGKPTIIGCFKTEEEAACAYDAAAIEVYGPSATTNTILGLFA